MAEGTKGRTAALYARYSSDLQHERSIDDQFALCRSLAERENLEVVATFSDRAKSGATTIEREGLLDLMTAAKARRFNVVIVENLDRLSRDQEDLAGIFKRLRYHEIEIITNEGTATEMHVGFRGLIGSVYLRDLGDRVRRGQGGRVKEGKFPGTIPYGYRLVPGKPGEREIDPAHAANVRRIFTEYAQGISPRKIAAALTADGIEAPDGGPWCHQTFVGGGLQRGIISNPIYIGRLDWNKSRTVLNPDSGKKTKRMNQSGILSVEVPHLRIMDDDLWQAANEVRKQRSMARFASGKITQPRGVPRNDHLLAGVLRCGACGGTMRLSTKVRGAQRIACAASHARGTCTHGKSYDLAKLTTGILDGMRKHLTDPEALAALAEAHGEQWAEREKERHSTRRGLQKQLNRVKMQIDRIITIVTETEEPLDGLGAKLKALEVERVGLAERLRLAEAESKVVALHPKAIAAYRANVEKLHAALTTAITHEAIVAFRNLIDCVVVHPTPNRADYEFTPYGRLSALMGIDLFPTVRSPQEILANEGAYAVAAKAIPNPPWPRNTRDPKSVRGMRSGKRREFSRTRRPLGTHSPRSAKSQRNPTDFR
jgi:DNA invertase Pin-like site-specific DNA recombinase